MPDVLALPLSEAVKMLQAAGWDYQVVRISSAYRWKSMLSDSRSWLTIECF